MKKHQIYEICGTDYKEMTKKLLGESHAGELIPNQNSLIGIKPNLVAPTEASYGATTHPEVVAGIIEYLQEHEYNNIIIVEGSWVGDKTEDAFYTCGYDRLCEQYGVRFVDAQKEKGIRKTSGELELNVCEITEQIDFLINVPVLKGHCQTKITCALKNMKGLIPNSEKRRFHALGLHEPIAHLSKVIPQDLIVVDNICGDLDFEDGGNPTRIDRVMIGRDPVLIDSYGCRLLGYEIDSVPYIKTAEKLSVGSTEVEKAELVLLGDRKPPKMRAAGKVVEVNDIVYEVESCSACYGYLIPALSMLKEEGVLEQLGSRICIGQGYRGKIGEDGLIGIGNCTSKFPQHLGGCPPTETQIYEYLKTYIEDKKHDKN